MHRLEHSFFHRLSGFLWTLIVAAIVALAVYVSFGRWAMSHVDEVQGNILEILNARLPFKVEAGGVSGRWHSFSPVIVLSSLRITLPGHPHQPIELGEGSVTLDVWHMLLSRNLHTSELTLKDLRLRGELADDGRLALVGLADGGEAPVQWLQDFLLNGEHIEVDAARLQLRLPDNSERDLRLDVDLRREGGRRHLSAAILSSGGTRISALAEGVGNPFRPESFTGELYLNMADVDLQALQGLLPDPMPLSFDDGELDLELWLAWQQGEPRVEAHVEGRDLLVLPEAGEWRVPVERIAFDASLVERRGRWTLFASDLQLVRNGHALIMPRVEMRLRGDSILLRSEQVALSRLNRILVELEPTPPALEKVFRILQPGGELVALELKVEDYRSPKKEWSLVANFRDLALDSWNGAPGTSAAAGYVKLGNGGGYVIVDGRDTSLDFPTVYKEPLRYKELYGTVNIDWFDDAVVLSSGLISARGPEGDVAALFGLNIPLTPTDVGLEMDLLAGVRNSDLESRSKYLPFILPPSLYGWLQDSVRDGLVEEGGFIWRGSLRRGQSAARTVQLFFDVADTRLSYHPAWPPISSLNGLVLIDDTDVSIWSENARLHATRVSALSAEAWMGADREVRLQISGRLQGPAGDAMTVIRESPLNDITRNVFNDWKLDGRLESELRLALNLSESAEAPRVSVRARPTDAQLDILPGNLRFTGIDGEISYSTERGFSSSDLRGRLWGEPMVLSLGQLSPTGGRPERYDPARSITRIDFRGDVRMAEIDRWLDLPAESVGRGRTTVSGEVRVAADKPVQVDIASDLKGVTLNLPAPLGGDEAGPLEVSLALGAVESTIKLSLQQQWFLDAALAGTRQGAVAIGLGKPPAALQQGMIAVGGMLPVADVQDWQTFLRPWTTSELSPASSEQRDQAALGQSRPGFGRGLGGTNTPIRLRLHDLGIGSLRLWAREFQDVLLNVERGVDHWQISAELDWLAGSLSLADEGDGSRLTIDRLDLGGMKQLESSDEQVDAQDWQLPTMKVSARNISQGDRQLGELDFTLSTADDVLWVTDLVGEVAGLRMLPEDGNQLEWRRGEVDRTALTAGLHFVDFGTTLQRFDYQRIIETGEGTFDLKLQWPGPPQQFALADAEGLVGFDVGAGRFLKAPPAASGALRVVSILNLAEIVSRLSLSHMFESGIPFRSVTGEAALHAGTIEVATLDVQGSSSEFQFTGLSSVAEQNLDGELVVTLPVASNLPWVAALAAGLPVAAGVFVVSKVFEKQFNQLTSAVYSISGSWDDPQVDFSRIFDVEAQSTPTADAGFRSVEGEPEVRAELLEPMPRPMDIPDKITD